MKHLALGPPLDKARISGGCRTCCKMERIQRFVIRRRRSAPCWQPSILMPSRGPYSTDVLSTCTQTSVRCAQEIFWPGAGPMTFERPRKRSSSPNNYGFTAGRQALERELNVSLQSQRTNSKRGVVWVNAKTSFVLRVGFGGVSRERIGREGGREDCSKYLEPIWFKEAPPVRAIPNLRSINLRGNTRMLLRLRSIARLKLYIGGSKARPDSGYSMEVRAGTARLLGESALGKSQKDIRNAVRGLAQAESWGKANRATTVRNALYSRKKLVATP